MNPYISLAKEAVENYIREKKIVGTPQGLLDRKSGVFVTIKKQGQLRGCIGTYLATRENIAEEIIRNAIAAATEDHRFGPIQEKELSSLSYTVYLLKEPELVKDMAELNPKKYGIIIKSGLKSGLLLPDLEGVDTVEKQIAIACQKAGINPSQESILIYRFGVEKHEQ